MLLCFAANSVLCRLALGPKLIDPATFTSVRVLSATAVLGAAAWLRRTSSPRARHINIGSVAALVAYLVCFSFAYVRLPAGTGALILFTAVQLTMFGVALREGERFSRSGWAGFVMTILGLLYLVLPGISAPDLLGSLLMSLSGIAWGCFSLLARGESRPVEANAINFLCCLPLAGAINLIDYASFHLTSGGLGLAVASGAVASGGGYVLWYRLLRDLPAARAAAIQLTVPSIAALGGVVFLSEPVTLRLLIASIVMLGGIAIVLLQRAPRTGG